MNAAPHQRELVASHIRYVKLSHRVQRSMSQVPTNPPTASTWSPFADPNLAPVSRCSAAILLIQRDPDLELACK